MKLTLGQAFGFALLGLEAYDAQNVAGSGGPSMFLNPAVVQATMVDFATIWNAGQPAPAAPSEAPAQGA